MSIPYEATGRRHQKARTREALVEATLALIAAGVTPTVEQSAMAASIARTTAYRYFPNQRALLAAAHPEIDARSLLSEDAPADPEARLDAVVDAYTRRMLETELQLRTMLRLSLEPDPSHRGPLLLRKGRAIAWIEDALTPLQETMSASERRRLALAIRSAAGIEALVWLTDVAALPRTQAVDLMRWSARALLRSALTDGPPPSSPDDRGSPKPLDHAGAVPDG